MKKSTHTHAVRVSLLSIMGLVALMVAIVLSPSPVMAVNNNDPGAPTTTGTESGACGKETFLGFPAWYKGLTKANGESCDIAAPSEVGGMSKFAWIIALNVVEMILRAAGYAAAAFIIYGGYKYMISAGSTDGMVGARKTIMNAAIGLVLSIAAVAIVNTVSNGLKIG